MDLRSCSSLRIVGVCLVLILAGAVARAEENRRAYSALFEQAAREFDVPADVLKGVAFAETRWGHLTWAPGDVAACSGMPRPYGIMSLWDNEHFGRSLPRAAALIGQPVETLKTDVRQNIRGAAALLRKLHNEEPLPEGTTPGDIESWSNAIAAYCGIPEVDLAQQHALDVFAFMHRGYHQHGIEWPGRAVKLDSVRQSVRKIQAARAGGKPKARGGVETAVTPSDPTFQLAAQPDYPGAIWRSAYPGHWYTSGNGRRFVVIHDMEGYYLSTISYFQQSNTQASAHYCINGLKDNAGDAPAGEITQMVEEKHYAWHARCLNTWSLGIEHEGFVNNPAWYTEAQYQASAALTRYLCDKYAIPKDRNHIIAHGEWQNAAWRSWMSTNFPTIDSGCNNHTDPGPNWAWAHYMDLVQDTQPPAIVTQPQGMVKNPGETASFNLSATGSLPLQFQWLRNGSTIPGATNVSLVLTNVQLASAANYSATVRNPVGVVTSTVAALNITAPAALLGSGTGLLGGYFDRENFSVPWFSRIDSTINFNWNASGPTASMGSDTFSIRWVGQVEPRYSQAYTFHVRSDDGARLWIGGQLLIDRLESQPATEWEGSFDMVAGRRYDLRLDYIEQSGNALAELRWSSASQVKQIIPRSQLYPPSIGIQTPATVIADEETLISFDLAGFDPDPTVGTALWREDFESFAAGSAGGTVLFRKPGYSGSTSLFLDGSADDTIVTDVFPAGHAGSRVLKVSWSFTGTATNPWLRLSTASTASLPNPTIDLGRALRFDLWADRPLRVGLGVRETGTDAVWGEDGGTSGPIEFVGMTNRAGGIPLPIRRVAPFAWTTLEFNLPFEPVAVFTGNGKLEAVNGRAVLEHLAFVPSGESAGPFTSYVDNFAVIQTNTLRYELKAGAPVGLVLNPVSGNLTWTPGEADGPGTNRITVGVSNRGYPPLVNEVSADLIVHEVNVPPSVVLPARWMMHGGGSVLAQSVAVDRDWPANVLRFDFAAETPPGATVDPVSGRVTWTPPESNLPSTNTIVVRVSDDGVPSLSATGAVEVVVLPAPRVSAAVIGEWFRLEWNSIPSQRYRIQFAENLDRTVWEDLGELVRASEWRVSWQGPISPETPRRFYKVVVDE